MQLHTLGLPIIVSTRRLLIRGGGLPCAADFVYYIKLLLPLVLAYCGHNILLSIIFRSSSPFPQGSLQLGTSGFVLLL